MNLLFRALRTALTLLLGVSGLCAGESACGRSLSIGSLYDAGADSALPPAVPERIGNGGIGDAPLRGQLHVYVIDGSVGTPVAAASVRIGEPSAIPLTGQTDSTGLISFEDPSLTGLQTITVSAPGYTAVTWFGVGGANVTIPLATQSLPDIPQAKLSGTIDNLPMTGADSLVTVVDYSDLLNLFLPDNTLPQTGSMTQCETTVANASCAFSLQARTGSVALFATSLDVNKMSTPFDPSDDTYTLKEFRYTVTDVEDGIDKSNLTLTQVMAGQISTMTIQFPNAPGPLTERLAVPAVELEGAGAMVLRTVAAFPDSGMGENEILVPKPEAFVETARYRVYALAQLAGATEKELPKTFSFRRDITDLTGPVQFPNGWLDLPTGMQVSSGIYSYTPVQGATLHTVDLVDDTTGVRLWTIAPWGGETSFSLPGVTPNPFATVTGDVRFVVNALDVQFDPQNVVFDDLASTIDRLASDQLIFTP